MANNAGAAATAAVTNVDQRSPNPAPPPPPPPPFLPLAVNDNVKVIHRKKPTRTFQVLLRTLATMASLAASLTMALNEETSVVAGSPMKASYKSSPSFRFFMYGNAAACGYTLLTLPMVSYYGCGWFIQLWDMLAMCTAAAAGAAAMTINYVEKHGNHQTGWLSVCNYYDNFCFRVSIAILCSYICLALLYLICAINCFKAANKRWT